MKSPYDVIIKPIITEKTMASTEEGKYTFVVAADAEKPEIKAAAEKKAEGLQGVALEIAAKVSSTGVTYGSVGAAAVAEALKNMGIEIDRKIITMREAKAVGDYEATVHFHKDVEVKIPVKVVAENAPEVVEQPVAEAPVAEEVEEFDIEEEADELTEE